MAKQQCREVSPHATDEGKASIKKIWQTLDLGWSKGGRVRVGFKDPTIGTGIEKKYWHERQHFSCNKKIKQNEMKQNEMK